MRSQSICHGTMFEWCSISVVITLSPSRTKRPPKLYATRLIEAVAPDVKTISRVEPAPMNRRTASRAASYSSVQVSLM